MTTRPFADEVGSGKPRHICSWQGMFNAIGTAGKLTSAGLAWPFATTDKLVSRVFNPVPFHTTIAYVINGNAVSGNFDLGLYTTSGELLGSTGSTAQSGTENFQRVTLGTPFWIPAGPLLLAMQVDNAVAKFSYQAPSAGFYPQSFLDTLGWGYDAGTGGALPLPSAIAPDTGLGTDYRPPLWGFLGRFG